MSNLDILVSISGRSPSEVATQAAQEAGKVIVDHFGSDKAIKKKGRGNLVTDIDTLAEKTILKLLKYEYPDFLVLSEETNSLTSVHGYTWIVDPLDGTNNYVFGIPNFCVNIALAYDNDILMGITYDPLRKETFFAEKGKGAYLNKTPVRVSQVTLLKNALIAFDLGYDEAQGKKLLDVGKTLWGEVHCIRTMGSSALALAYVSCGRISLYLHRYLYPWDIASGILLIREAGGIITDWEGNEINFLSKRIIASNVQLHGQFLSSLPQIS